MKINLIQSNRLKTIAILMMLFLHLFNTNYHGLFEPLLFIGAQPLSYYISLFCDACVPIFAFVSGYGLFYKYQQDPHSYKTANIKRVLKLYVNFWIILLLFAVLLGLILGKSGYPGNLTKLFWNISGLHVSYNGAWWFFTTYVFFVFTSGFWFRFLNKINPYFYLLVLLVVYVIAFYFRIYKTDLFSLEILKWFHIQSALYFCTLFQFMLGAFALRYNWNDKFSETLKNIPLNLNFLAILGILILVILHGFIPNLIIAPFTALGFILLYLQLNINKKVAVVLDFFTPHYTNMWLMHMFFYLIYFKDFVYSFSYVPLIFLVLIGMSVISSYIVNYFNQKITVRL